MVLQFHKFILQYAMMRGAACRDQQKRATYSRVETNGYPFVPFSVESYGRIGHGQQAMKLVEYAERLPAPSVLVRWPVASHSVA
jgi:phosphoribulokinase